MKTTKEIAEQVQFIRQQRERVKNNGREVVHVVPKDEPHRTDGEVDDEGLVCWCDPNFEDFSHEGGGVLVIHVQHTWQ